LTAHSTVQFPWNQWKPFPEGYKTVKPITNQRLYRALCPLSLLAGVTRRDFMFMSILIEVQVSITLSDIELYADSVEAVRAAEKLKETLWGKNVDNILSKTSDNAWLYVSKERIKMLELQNIGYSERNGLLIRPEYGAALFNLRFKSMEKFCGVVIAGQPGIGLFSNFSFPIIKLTVFQT
jgi:hypothetical protein